MFKSLIKKKGEKEETTELLMNHCQEGKRERVTSRL